MRALTTNILRRQQFDNKFASCPKKYEQIWNRDFEANEGIEALMKRYEVVGIDFPTMKPLD